MTALACLPLPFLCVDAPDEASLHLRVLREQPVGKHVDRSALRGCGRPGLGLGDARGACLDAGDDRVGYLFGVDEGSQGASEQPLFELGRGLVAATWRVGDRGRDQPGYSTPAAAPSGASSRRSDLPSISTAALEEA